MSRRTCSMMTSCQLHQDIRWRTLSRSICTGSDQSGGASRRGSNYPKISSMAETLRRLRITPNKPYKHPLDFFGAAQLRLSLLEYLEVAHDGSRLKVRLHTTAPIRSTEEVRQVPPHHPPHFLYIDYLQHANEHLPRLRVVVWSPAWADVQGLYSEERSRALFHDVQRDVFAFLKIRTFAVILPRGRCVRFESSDEKPQYTVFPRNRFDNVNWQRIEPVSVPLTNAASALQSSTEGVAVARVSFVNDRSAALVHKVCDFVSQCSENPTSTAGQMVV
ncbi:hypothetical protein C8T65DRAFT_666323 [Cerioporus squamosus]|nr:hypothetical protein C8T65DRAFT_666323 [Cerioporus squamosus]